MPDDPYTPQNPPPPSTPPAYPPGAPLAATGLSSTGLQPNIAAGIAVLFSFISGIVFLVIEKRSQYVRFWAMQSTIYGLIWLAVRILLEIFLRLFVTSLSMLSFVSNVWTFFNLVFGIGAIIMLYFAFTGKEWEMPILGKIARQQLVKFPPKP